MTLRAWTCAAVLWLAGERAVAAPSPELVRLAVDGADRGDVIVLVDGDALWLPAAMLCELRLCRPGGIERDGVRYVAIGDLDGVAVRLDRAAGELALHVGADALSATTISFGSRAPEDIEYARDPSLFVNYALLGDVRTYGGTHGELGGALEGGLSLAGALAYGAVSVVETRHVVRGLSNVSVDWRAKLVRLTAGDEVVTGGVLSGGGVIGGLHVSRDFSLDPYFVAQPTLTQSGVVSEPSTVEVYRDGQLIRRVALPPGPYRIEDLAGPTGADTKIIVRDAFGLTRMAATSTVAPPASALRPGLSTFAYSLGVVRRLGRASFDYGDPALFAVHRRGVTRRLTVGAHTEATPARANATASALVSWAHTTAEATAGASTARMGHGQAAALNVAWYRRSLTLAALVRVVGERYATIDLAPEADRAVAQVDCSASWSITPRATLLAQTAAERMRDAGDRWRAGITSNLQITDTARLFLSVSTARQIDRRWTTEAAATFAWSWGTRTTASSSVTGTSTDREDTGSVAVAASRALPAGSGLGYQASASTGRTQAASARVLAQGELGRIDASADYSAGLGHAGINVAGGIVAIGGAVKATRPVQGGFALVRVADARGVRTYLDNQPMGTTDDDGELILPELQAYYGNRIRIDARDLPLDVSTQDLDRTIAPPRRGGVVVELAPRRTLTVRGRLTGTAGGQPFDVSYGELILDGVMLAPIGHAGAFEIEAARPGHHRGVVAVDGQRCTFELELAAEPAIVDVGALTCQVVAP